MKAIMHKGPRGEKRKVHRHWKVRVLVQEVGALSADAVPHDFVVETQGWGKQLARDDAASSACHEAFTQYRFQHGSRTARTVKVQSCTEDEFNSIAAKQQVVPVYPIGR